MTRKTQNLRISHYLEDKSSPGRVGAIVCFTKERETTTVEVQLGCMSLSERINEWTFGNPMDIGKENIIITVEIDSNLVLHFQCFRPDLRSQPCKETHQ